MARRGRYQPIAHVEEGVRLVARIRVAAQPDEVAEELRRLAEEWPWIDAGDHDDLVSAGRLAEIAGPLGAPLASLAGLLAPPGAPSQIAIGSRFAFVGQRPAHTLVRHEFELRVPPGLLRRAEATILRALLRRAQATLLRRLRARVGLESLAAVGDRLGREVLLALRVGGPRTAAALAVELRTGSGRVARALGALADAGYVSRHGGGDTWSALADTRSLEFPVTGGGAAVVSLIEGVSERLPSETAESDLRLAGERYGRRLAALGAPDAVPATSLAGAAAQVAELLSRLGHDVRVEANGAVAVLRPASCPLRPAIRSDLRTLPFDVGMWQGMLRTAMPDLDPAAVRIDCSGCLDAGQPCAVRVSPLDGAHALSHPEREAPAPRGPAPA